MATQAEIKTADGTRVVVSSDGPQARPRHVYVETIPGEVVTMSASEAHALAAALADAADRIDPDSGDTTGMTLDDARAAIGRRVAYHPEHGPTEEGVITSVGHVYVYVRYGDEGTTSQATAPHMLELLDVADVASPTTETTGGDQ